jgi:hypothetical protein
VLDIIEAAKQRPTPETKGVAEQPAANVEALLKDPTTPEQPTPGQSASGQPTDSETHPSSHAVPPTSTAAESYIPEVSLTLPPTAATGAAAPLSSGLFRRVLPSISRKTTLNGGGLIGRARASRLFGLMGRQVPQLPHATTMQTVTEQPSSAAPVGVQAEGSASVAEPGHEQGIAIAPPLSSSIMATSRQVQGSFLLAYDTLAWGNRRVILMSNEQGFLYPIK